MRCLDHARRAGAPLTVLLILAPLWAQVPGEEPGLAPDRPTQDDFDVLSFNQLREAGMLVFTTPFNKLDGHGDGPVNPADTTSPGGRPTLQGNGTFLRINGLDAQTCLDCHAIISNASRPPTLGIGGVGTANNNAVIMPTAVDLVDLDLDGDAAFNGRFANPPFVFGLGGVELLAMEMTEDLQALKQMALDNPGVIFPLTTKGVSFGTLVATSEGELDTSGVEGVAEDLVVRPFGRKGEFATAREFDVGAMQFHFGMQPVEAVGEGIDADGDGVVNEITVGDLSALSLFVTSSARPAASALSSTAQQGFNQFQIIGCASCHMPELQTVSSKLPLRFPEVPTSPRDNTFYEVDLTKPPALFEKNGQGGLRVPLFADLKRHDMGEGLAEDFALADEATNREFTTARLWGIADTAPYLHDGRATTLTEAILAHGGEGQAASDAFDALSDTQKAQVLDFLRTLKTPREVRRILSQHRGGGVISHDPDADLDFIDEYR